MNLAALLDAIALAPDLPGALCRGMFAAFDPPERGEPEADVNHRHQVALRMCRTCPALASCRRWFDALPEQQRPPGVIAGLVVASNGDLSTLPANTIEESA